MPHSQILIYACPLENTRVQPYSDRLLWSDPHAWKMEGGQARKYELHASFLDIIFETENPGVR